MVRRVIVVFPVLALPAPIMALRQRFDPLAERVAPHLTLVFPFESTLSPTELQAHVQHAVGGVSAFPLTLADVTGSEGAYLFLNVKRGNDDLIALHDRLYTGCLRPYLALTYTFVPHLTVGRLGNPRAFDEALRVAGLAHVSSEAWALAVSVYRIEADGARPVESETPLPGHHQ